MCGFRRVCTVNIQLFSLILRQLALFFYKKFKKMPFPGFPQPQNGISGACFRKKSCMITRSIYLYLLAAAVLAAACKTQPKAGKTALPKNPNRHTLLWQVSGNGLQKPSFIFGTMHLLCKEDAAMSDGLKKAMAASEKIYMELDMDNMGEMMMGMMAMMNMKNGVTLKKLVTPEEYEKIKTFFTKEQSLLPFSMMESMKPLLLASTIMEDQAECKTAGMGGMEMSIMAENGKNNAAKKEILGLETMAMQAGVFDSIPYEKQAKELLQMIDSAASVKAETEKLTKAYLSQNLDSIERLAMTSEPGLNDYMDILLYRRNQNWVTQLKTIMAKQPVLAAVGAAHLVGPQGLIELLKKAGYTLTPLKN